MNIVLPFWKGDYDQAKRWLSWTTELGAGKNHKLWMIPAMGLDYSEASELSKAAFPQVEIIPDNEGVVSDWTGTAHTRDASGPNSAYRQVAWHFFLNKLGPWWFVEPDALFTKPDSIDIMENAYQNCGKPYLGNFVRVPAVLNHLTGVSVYHQDTPMLVPSIVSRRHSRIEDRVVEIAFDVAGATEILPQSFISILIQHVPRHPGFKSMEEVDALIDPNAVLFHMQKDGSLIPFLRQKLFGSPIVVGNGVSGEPQTEVHCVSSHETSSDIPQKNLSIAEQIRFHAYALEKIVSGNASRGLTVVAELRKRKLIPQAKKRK